MNHRPNVKSYTIKLPEKNTEENLWDSKDFSDTILKNMSIKNLFYFLFVGVVTSLYMFVKTHRTVC